MKKLLLVVPVALAVAPAAQAGGWATVKLSSMPTTRVWTVTVTPLQHGRTLIPNAKPRVEVLTRSNGWRTFVARPTAKPGVFRARVIFPRTGTWRFRVWDGFEAPCGRYHNYPAVTLQ
jgi:hypothetical protein